VSRARKLWDIAKSLDDCADAISERARSAQVPLHPSQEWLQRRYRHQADWLRNLADNINPLGGTVIRSLVRKDAS